ncbi:MAG TPA: hypothetical protein VHI54_08845 [Actinomycetota bacterium]|nr:hypothetical protein [Actinomycetota bacterium]
MALFGRATEIQSSPQQIEEGLRHLRDETMPALREFEGAKGFIAFGNRETGKLIGISLWESQDAMVKARDRASQLRSAGAQAAGGQITDVTEYEVMLDERF